MESEFKHYVKRYFLRLRPIIAVSLVMGCFLCLFVNNIAVSMTNYNAGMGSMYSRMYFKATGVVPAMICGFGSVAFLEIIPRMRERHVVADRTKYRLAAIALAAAIIETVLLAVHTVLVLLKNGDLDGYAFLPVGYMGMFLLAMGFASIAYLGVSLFSEPKKMLMFDGGLSALSILSSMLGILSFPTMVMAGAGADWCDYFYCFSLTGFVDIDSLTSIGTSSPDYGCLIGYAGLLAFSAVFLAAAHFISDRKNAPASPGGSMSVLDVLPDAVEYEPIGLSEHGGEIGVGADVEEVIGRAHESGHDE